MKRGIVDCTDDLACRFIAKSEEVWKVILAESGIVGTQASDTLVADGRRFVGKHSGISDRLDTLAMFFPLFQCDFLFSSSSHDNLLDAHLLRNIEVLVFIDSLDEFRSNFRVNSRTIFNPLRECHENLNGIYYIGLLIEFLNYRG